MSARKIKVFSLVLTLGLLFLLSLLLTLPVSAASGSSIAVGDRLFDSTEDQSDLFGDGRVTYRYDAERNIGTLTLSGYNDSTFPDSAFPYLTVWNGENGETTRAYFSVIVIGKVPVFINIEGDTYLSKGITVEKGKVTFSDARVTFGPDIACGAAVHDGDVTVRNSELTLKGVEGIHPTRPESGISAFLYGYDVLVDHSTVTCNITGMNVNIYSDGFLYAERDLVLADSTITLKSDKVAFLRGFASYSGLIQATDCKIDLMRPQWCFAAYAKAGIGSDGVEGAGSVSFSNTTVTATDSPVFADCVGFAAINSEISAETISQGIISTGTADTYVILRGGSLSLKRAAYDNGENGSFGILVKGGALVLADGRFSIDGYGCGLCAYGQTQLSLEKKVRLDIDAGVCAFFIASQIDQYFNATVDYTVGNAALYTTEIPGSVKTDGTGRYVSAFTRGSTAFAFSAEDPSAVEDIWDLVLACSGDSVMHSLRLRTQGAYLRPWAIVLICVGGVAVFSVGGWFLWRYYRRKHPKGKVKKA